MASKKSILKIDYAGYDACVYDCKNFHYSKSVPFPPLFKIGVWEDNKFIGVVIFSKGANRNIGSPYGLSQTEVCELTRIALSKHDNQVSRIMSIAIKFLKKANPKLKLIVSYADPNEGHYGGIYQATNWIYTGMTMKKFSYIDKNGKKLHSRRVSVKGYALSRGEVIKTVKKSDCKKIEEKGKHRYLFPLTKEIRKK